MEPQRKSDGIRSIDDEAERVRNIFTNSFPQSESDLNALLPKNFTTTLAEKSVPPHQRPEDEFDWSITLANVETIVEAANAGRLSVLEAERRAELAEARAQEALHWLRALHDAVLRGLPTAVPKADTD